MVARGVARHLKKFAKIDVQKYRFKHVQFVINRS